MLVVMATKSEPNAGRLVGASIATSSNTNADEAMVIACSQEGERWLCPSPKIRPRRLGMELGTIAYLY